jgi:ribonuclease BN (tRNA processing enzyme)
MMLSLTILGSGTILPAKGHGCAGYLLQTDVGPALIDCGPGTLYRLTEIDAAVTGVNPILISHFHLDHVSDLGPLLVSRWLATLEGGDRRLTLVGPAELRGHVKWLGKRVDEIADLRLDIRGIEPGTPLTLGRLAASATVRSDAARATAAGNSSTAQVPGAGPFLRIEAGLTGHTGTSVCYRLTDERGAVLFYSGDTDYNEELLPLMQGADLALLECSMPDERKVEGHLTPRLAGRLARMAEVKRLVLTHFYREVIGEPIVERVREEYAGPVELAEDLKSFAIDARITPLSSH